MAYTSGNSIAVGQVDIRVAESRTVQRRRTVSGIGCRLLVLGGTSYKHCQCRYSNEKKGMSVEHGGKLGKGDDEGG